MQEIQFEYFHGVEAEQYSFYRVPKILFTAECFRTLSCEAKVLYGLMLDRMSLSIKNRWLDKEDRVYIIFTVEEIAELLNCGTQKAVKLIKELDGRQGIGLIEKKRLGLGKPNVIYVKNFMVKEKVLSIQEEKEEESTEILQNSENHNSGMVKIKTQEYPKSQSIDTDISKTEYNEREISIQSYLSFSEEKPDPDKEDVIERMEVYRELIRTNIDYDCFTERRDDVDELVELIVDIMMLPDESLVRIGGTDKPASMVKSQFMKLTYSHIEYVLFSLQRNSSKVANIKSYLLTTLYNSLMTMSHYYQAEVQHDLYGGSPFHKV